MYGTAFASIAARSDVAAETTSRRCRFPAAARCWPRWDYELGRPGGWTSGALTVGSLTSGLAPGSTGGPCCCIGTESASGLAARSPLRPFSIPRWFDHARGRVQRQPLHGSPWARRAHTGKRVAFAGRGPSSGQHPRGARPQARDEAEAITASGLELLVVGGEDLATPALLRDGARTRRPDHRRAELWERLGEV